MTEDDLDIEIKRIFNIVDGICKPPINQDTSLESQEYYDLLFTEHCQSFPAGNAGQILMCEGTPEWKKTND